MVIVYSQKFNNQENRKRLFVCLNTLSKIAFKISRIAKRMPADDFHDNI